MMPQNITAGDTLKYTLEAPADYLPSAGYTATLAIRGPQLITITGSVDGTSFVFEETAATTASWAEGLYNYVIFVEKATEQVSIETGQTTITLRADLQTQTDVRTHARKVLDAIEAVIENRATTDQKSYSINGRSLERTPISELLSLRNYYREQVANESPRGRTTATKLYVRM